MYRLSLPESDRVQCRCKWRLYRMAAPTARICLRMSHSKTLGSPPSCRPAGRPPRWALRGPPSVPSSQAGLPYFLVYCNLQVMKQVLLGKKWLSA